jgi:hypothetical protein
MFWHQGAILSELQVQRSISTEDGTSVPKHVGLFKALCMSCIILCAFVGGYTDCRNMHGMNNTKNDT